MDEKRSISVLFVVLLAGFSGNLSNPSKTLNQLFELVLRVDQLKLPTVCIFDLKSQFVSPIKIISFDSLSRFFKVCLRSSNEA